MASTTTTTLITSTTASLAFATTFTAPPSASAPVTVFVQPPSPATPTTSTTLPVTTITTFVLPGQSDTKTILLSDIETYTHIDATYFFADPNGFVTSTYTTEFLYGPVSRFDDGYAGVRDDEEEGDGWDSWSMGAKVGLVVGVVIAALVLLWACTCCYKRNTAWVAHDWRWAGAVEGR